jgi:hypothetical protein
MAHLARERRRALHDDDAKRIVDAPTRRGRAIDGDLIAPRRVKARLSHARHDVLVVGVGEVLDL